MQILTLCRKDQPDKRGNLPIFFRVNRIKFSAKESVPLGSWDQTKSQVKSRYAGADLINKRLTKKKAALQAIIDGQSEFDVDAARVLFNKYLDNPNKLDDILTSPVSGTEVGEFFVLIDHLIHEYRSKWSDGYKKRFRTIRTKFIDFDPGFTINNLTIEWWREFVNYCIDDLDNSNNTISTDAKVINKLVDILRDKGYVINKGLDEIGTKYIEPEMMALEWSDIEKIAKLDLSDPLRATMPASRTLWLIGAYTGRRWGEIERMTKHNFYQDKDERWRYKNIAKGMKPIDIPLLPEAVALLKKIKFTIPKLVQQTVNLDIKDIAQAAGIDKDVMVAKVIGKEIKETVMKESKTVRIHTGRHSYAMRIVDLSAGQAHAEKFVSFMLGHASHATTWKYMNRRASSHDKMFDSLQRY